MNDSTHRYGNGNVGGIRTFGPLGMPSTMPLIRLRWAPIAVPGEGVNERRTKATFKHVKGTKKTTITISREDFDGTALADLTFVVTGAAAKSAWSGALTASAAANALTIKDLMDLLNQIHGLNCEVLNAPYDLSINTTTGIESVTECDIPIGIGAEASLETLFLHDTAQNVSYMRIGLPDVFDAASMKLVKAEGTCSGTVTTSKFSIYRDNYAEYGDTAEYVIKDEILTTARKVFIGADANVSPFVQSVRGSLIVKVGGGSSTLTAMDYRVQVINDQLGS